MRNRALPTYALTAPIKNDDIAVARMPLRIPGCDSMPGTLRSKLIVASPESRTAGTVTPAATGNRVELFAPRYTATTANTISNTGPRAGTIFGVTAPTRPIMPRERARRIVVSAAERASSWNPLINVT